MDRYRAKSRSETVARMMKDVSFEKSMETLAAYCFALMQNLPPEEQQQGGKEVAGIASSGMNDAVKAMMHGIALMSIVGEVVLSVSVDALGDKIR